MNIAQRIILVLGTLVIVGAVVYPPWASTGGYRRSDAGTSQGWHLIMSTYYDRINTSLLLSEIAIIAVVTGLLCLAARKSN